MLHPWRLTRTHPPHRPLVVLVARPETRASHLDLQLRQRGSKLCGLPADALVLRDRRLDRVDEADHLARLAATCGMARCFASKHDAPEFNRMEQARAGIKAAYWP